MAYSITVTQTNQTGGVSQTNTANYTSQDKSDLDHIMIMCEALYGMVFTYDENDEDEE